MDYELLYKRYEHSAKVRGVILEATVELERLVDDFLSLHFCSDGTLGNELKEMLWATERVTFGGKKDLLFLILGKYHKEFLKSNPEFKQRLELLLPERNKFAHLEIDRSYKTEDGAAYQIVFKKYKHGKLVLEKYGKVEIEKLHIEFEYLIDCLEFLITSKAL